MAPALVLIVTFVIYPSLRTIFTSFLDENGKFSLKNYVEVLKSRDTFDPEGFSRGFPLGTLLHNLIWIAIHLPLTISLGLILAVILRKVKGGNILKSIIFLGMVMPMIVGGVMVRFMFDGSVGVVNGFLRIFGIEGKTWTAYPDTALFSLIFGSVWLWTGFSMVLYSAGLETIPKDFYEAAAIDGATPLKIFFKITIPLLKPVTVVVTIMTLLWELKIFDIVYVATMGGPGGASNVLALQMYTYAFRELNYGKASVVAVILTVSTLLASIPLTKSAGELR
ncbi:MAG TPA: sugar ABC transporter permease [Thermotoga sp.]|nr:MAG: sugar ABC transporter permease [Thermotogota bacterium]RKX55927.1 MAG: sugar ABC transporter permease [Thermotoga sp.]HDG61591.1 sugar ABC transporter permease [Thermotoga sp.]